MEELEEVFSGAREEEVPGQFRLCLMREMSTQTAKLPRGRRPNPKSQEVGCRKNEEKDKFWLRAFRSAMKRDFPKLKKGLGDRSFWRDYLGKFGEPGKSHQYPSYNRKYKNHLFSHTVFTQRFRTWLDSEGAQTLRLKHNPDTKPETYRMLWEYAREVLAVYQVEEKE